MQLALIRRKPRSRRVRTAAFAFLLTVLAVGPAALTAALFGDSASIGGNQFSASTVHLTTNPTTTLLTLPGMVPGDRVTAPLTVTNNGTANLRYSMLSTTTEDLLASGMQLNVKAGVNSCDSGGFGASGTALYGPDLLGSTGGTKILGDAKPGADPGDRSLDAGASEVLCVQAALPLGADNTLQNQTTTATFRFDAEQRRNNGEFILIDTGACGNPSCVPNLVTVTAGSISPDWTMVTATTAASCFSSYRCNDLQFYEKGTCTDNTAWSWTSGYIVASPATATSPARCVGHGTIATAQVQGSIGKGRSNWFIIQPA